MLLKDKKCLIFGVANNRSIAYGIASCFKEQGARLAFSYAGEAIHKRVEPISEELGGEFIFPCDVTSDEDITAAAALVKEKWGSVDVLVHSVAFANREDLTKRFIETSRDGFATALNVSAYSLTALCHAFEPMLNPGAPSLTWTSDIYFPSLRCIRLHPGYSLRAIGHDFNNSIILCTLCLVKPFSNIFYENENYFAGLTMRFISLSFTRMVLTTVMPSVAFFTLSSSMARCDSSAGRFVRYDDLLGSFCMRC